jgi:hypothetical protein
MESNNKEKHVNNTKKFRKNEKFTTQAHGSYRVWNYHLYDVSSRLSVCRRWMLPWFG